MTSAGEARGVRVGVTGHRALADPARVAAEVDRVLDDLARGGPDDVGVATLTVVSGLAEGADRLVAERVLARPGARLEAILPLDPDDYAGDFATPGSRREFTDLLGRADRVTVTHPPIPDPMPVDAAPAVEAAARTEAYARAGSAMVAASDVVLALWDGKAARGVGGTGDVVAEALVAGRRVEIITVERATP